jgi:ATP-dependent Lhr-like helicase
MQELIENWFASRAWTPFEFQREVWRRYLDGESGLMHAATGTGKTYAAWLGPLLQWMAESAGTHAAAPQGLRVLWITPLRALASDTEAALAAPLDDLGLPWTLEARTGDTTTTVRKRQRDRLPNALVTTPESLSLFLSQPDARDRFSRLRLVVVDEWHELMATKRGVQIELALARLRAFQPALQTWGLSATLGNLESARDTLLGVGNPGVLIRGMVPKSVRIDCLIPPSIERFPWAGHLGTQMIPQVIAAIEEGRTAIVFTNTRSQAEIWFQSILFERPDWAGKIALHHGSLDRKIRRDVETLLSRGRLRCVVSTSSLDLGVDFTPVDRVLQVGSPKGVARLIQRAGRSGHQPGVESRVTCVPTHGLELVEVAAARDAVRANAIESRYPVERPLDVLAQHLITVAIGGGFLSDEMLEEVRTTNAYRSLREDEWHWVMDFVTTGGPTLKAYPAFSRVIQQDGRYTVANRTMIRRHRMSIGTIVSDSALTIRFLSGGTLGTIEESYISRMKPGERFIFAGKPLEFVRVKDMVVYVRRARKLEGAMPRWMGSRMPLSSELASAIRNKLEEARTGKYEGPEMAAIRPLLELQAARSRIPAPDELLIERTRTRDGHHLFFYPFEGRLVHEGLGALFAYRIAALGPITFTVASNDYGFELLSPTKAPIEEALENGLLSPNHLLHDISASLNAAEMARRQFREIARVAGLIFTGYPGAGKSIRQLQVSSGLLFDVFSRYDPANLLLDQANREVLERQLERSRLGRTLERLSAGKVLVVDVERHTPLALPLLVDRTRGRVSSEKLADRVRRMARHRGPRARS